MAEAEEVGGHGSIECSQCGETSPAGSRFCGACGSPLIQALTCPGCGSENPAGYRFCGQCGEPLAAPTERDPRAYMPRHLANKIRASRGRLQGERKQVTVLVADVVGSMELAERSDPEEFRALTDRLFAILSEGVHRFEGTVEKFTGDGVMALFGAPIAHEDHARRACYAALHLQEKLAEYAVELRTSRDLDLAVRIGLNSGEVVVGSIGDDLELFYTAVGHSVRLAQRMEEVAEPGTSYVTENTAKLVEGYVDLQDVGEFGVDGVAAPVRVHELTGMGPVRRSIDLAQRRGFSRFVGRQDELRQLDAALDNMVAGDAQILGVVGEPGVGKSRLCHEFIEHCRSRGLAVYEGHGQPHTKPIPFLPMLELLRSYFGIGEDDSDRAARDRIAGKLLLLDERFADDLPLIFDFLAVPDPDRPPATLNAEARQRQLLKLGERLVRAQTQRQPTVTVVEDLQWIDPSSEVFLATLLEALPGTRALAVVSFRPEYWATWMGTSYYRQIPLAPLGGEAVEVMLADLLGSDPSLDGLSELIRERTAGNPFFVEELVQSLVEAGNLDGSRGSHRVVKTVDHTTLTASVHAVLSARIDRLADRDKAVLQTASVIGREFSQPVLAAASGLPDDELGPALGALVAAEHVYERALFPHPEYAFKHPLTREVAYSSQLGERRARTHAAVAQAIENQSGERIEERAALVAQHREQAGDALEAARWYARGAAWAGFNDPSAALEHWRRVVGLTRQLEGGEAELLAIGARVYILQLAWRLGVPEQETDELFGEAKELAERHGELAILPLVLCAYAQLKGMSGDITTHLELGMQALASARTTRDPALVVLAGTVAAYALHTAGRSSEALELLEEPIQLCERNPALGAGLGMASPFAFIVSFEGYTLTRLGRLEEAAASLERGRRLALKYSDRETAGWNHMCSGVLCYYLGDDDGALAHAQQGAETAEETGDSLSRVWARTVLGLAHVARGEWGEAADALEAARSLSRERQVALVSEPMWLAGLSVARAGLGEPERAREAIAEALLAIDASESPSDEFEGGRWVAHAMLDLDGAAAVDQARPVLERALTVAGSTGARSEEALVRLQLARLERLDGNQAAATEQAEEAHRILVEIGASRRARQVQQQLDATTV